MLKKHFLSCRLILGVSLFFCALLMSVAVSAEPVDSLYSEDVNLIKGEITEIKVYSLTRLSLEAPGIADVINADDQEIVVIGKQVGQTSLFIWDEYGKRILMIHVYEQDLERVKSRLEELFESAGIKTTELTINEQEGKIIVSGDVPEHQKDHFDKLIGPFSNLIIDIVDEEDQRQLIQIDAEVIDVSSTLIKGLGIEWSTSLASSGISLGFNETLPDPSGETGGSWTDLFNRGEFNRSGTFTATFNALIQEGDSKIISRPKMVVLNGESASFNVGGEYPIKSTTAQGDSSVENISFKPYGVGMEITPTVIKGKIELDVSINVSDVDSSISVSDAAAFTTTDVSTILYLEDGQMVIIAGLIKTNNSETTKRIPYLSKIPVVGRLLFTNKSRPADSDRELIITIKPTILSRKETEGVQKKGQGLEHLSKEDLIVAEEEEMVPTDKPIGNHMTAYVKDVQQKIAKAIAYPEEAKASGWEGTVKIGLNILKDGTLYYTMLKESSGNELIDKDALKTVRKVAPYKRFPDEADEEEISIVIPIAYSIN